MDHRNSRAKRSNRPFELSSFQESIHGVTSMMRAILYMASTILQCILRKQEHTIIIVMMWELTRMGAQTNVMT
jgi:hypothetical protein